MIQVRGLTKRFGEVTAVDDLTFDVTPGAVTGFLGANGAGKSTTMRMVLGLDAPTSGTATVAGRPYRELASPAREVGALLDPRCMHPGRTARAHLRWMAEAAGLPRARVEEVLGLAGVADAAGRRIGTFSLGMRQRVGIAGALLGDPDVLVLDEPLNGLDPQGIAWVRTLLHDLAAQGRTVFVSSHLLHEMEATAQRVVVIGKGRLIDALEVSALRGRTTTVHTRAVDAGETHRLGTLLTGVGARVSTTDDGLACHGVGADDIGRLARRHGIALGALTVTASGLEESFLALTSEKS
ncbi:ABC transporter ATP-binding protein [Pseudonocardia abyssalis]|uniref:ATP-binding cassette domain-containing protein n=1 Tax=Pseudonocardia abyssalis TaxID=2792008 RepID=A0ABS6UTE3_9PSEU|nr:ATP-binding cassette domain-containing protein [Pseudonocardia abyssalis]MBW0117413.1 ATP-binding cassette domain-containing protein [Pseudonocardia abyssalis]MBW0135533.1 ATP-binding cassette domain-containing protein [Pseudonocardia abyssalis]